jgi:hypothetical protein
MEDGANDKQAESAEPLAPAVAPRKHPLFQFYLSTAIVMMLAGGILVVPLLVSLWTKLLTHPDNKGTPWGGIVLLGLILSLIYSFVLLLPVFLIEKWIRARQWRRVAGMIAAVVCTMLFIAFTPAPLPIPYQIHAVLFRERMRFTADIPAIQEWQRTLTIQPADNGNLLIPQASWPPCVQRLSPRFVGLMPAGAAVVIYIGGGACGHWGLIVAPKGSNTPPPGRHEYRFRLCDGADVFEAE